MNRNNWGVFAVNYTKNGAAVQVMLDNYIPVKRNSHRYGPCFSTAHGNELWVIILEKAWAKLHGDYIRIINGLSHETFRDVTGAPAYMFYTADHP